MSYFASDRDLLVYEPTLFRDVGWLGQRLVKGTGSVSGTTLTMSSQDVALDAAGVAAGNVAVVGGTAYEVLARVSGTALTISRLRDDASGAALPPSAASGQDVSVPTFVPQIAVAHRQVLRMLSIEPQDPAQAGQVTQASITNPGALTRLVCLGALAIVWDAAGIVGGAASDAGQRAALYRARFLEERRRVGVRIDADGDGVSDATRAAGVFTIVRV